MISSAIESWLLRQPLSVNEYWEDWEERDAVLLMTVIETARLFAYLSLSDTYWYHAVDNWYDILSN